MPEWSSYSLSDFLMFSPGTYWRLVELHNLQWWPAHLVALSGGLAATALAPTRPRAACLLLALAWAWTGWAFHWQRYADINWGAQYLAGAFALQALLLLVLARRREPRGFMRTGRAIAAAGLLLYPLLAPLSGRPWLQAEVFGMAPEPTALVTLGLLLAMPLSAGARAALAALPLLSLAIGAATLWTMSAGG